MFKFRMLRIKLAYCAGDNVDGRVGQRSGSGDDHRGTDAAGRAASGALREAAGGDQRTKESAVPLRTSPSAHF